MGQVRANKDTGELLLIDTKDTRCNMNELRKGCVAIWLRYNCTSYEAGGVVAVTRSWAEYPPNALVPTCAKMRAMGFVANVRIE